MAGWYPMATILKWALGTNSFAPLQPLDLFLELSPTLGLVTVPRCDHLTSTADYSGHFASNSENQVPAPLSVPRHVPTQPKHNAAK